MWGIVDEVTPYSVHLHGDRRSDMRDYKMFSHRFFVEENPGEGKSFRGYYFYTNSLNDTPDALSDPAYGVYNTHEDGLADGSV